ncbi:hypothetical protein Ndes2526A_g05819 [Nannochloris sp. 'desiccata']
MFSLFITQNLAAHCLKSRNDAPLPPPSDVCVVHGTTNMTEGLSNYNNYTLIASKEYAIYPSYNQLKELGEFHITGDVALLFLNEPILAPAQPESYIASSTSNPGYALLPNPNQNWDRFSFAFFGVTIGWGLTENATRTYNQPGDPEPQRLDVERITFQVAMTPEECRSQPLFYGTKNQPEDTFCGAWFGGFENLFGSGGDKIVSTICRGDSGGGLVIPSTIIDPFGFQGDVQIGIVSAGPPCPYTPFNDSIVWPAEYVDVSQYVPWIHDEMKARGYTPLRVATSPLGKAYKNQTCFPGNCYEENVMEGVLTGDDSDNSNAKTSNAAGKVNAIMASLVGIVAAPMLF